MSMINFKNILRIIIVSLGIILVILSLAIIGAEVAGQNKSVDNYADSSVEKARTPEENYRITYILNKGEGQEALKMDYFLSKVDKKTVFDVLKELSVSKGFELKYNNNYSFGVFIESIAMTKNGDEGKYWQYYINDQLGDVAADKKEVKNGDSVVWVFEKVPEF